MLAVSTVQIPTFSHQTSWLEDRAENSKHSYHSAKSSANTLFNKIDKYLTRNLYTEKEPLKAWPKGVNPHTGEVGGPKGPEPTRYGDWERKGRVSDF